MAIVDRVDEQQKKRRSLSDIAASGEYPGAIPPVLPKLAALLPSGSQAPFNDNPNFNPNQPYLAGGQANFPQPAAQPAAAPVRSPLAAAAARAPTAPPPARTAYQDEVGPPAYLSPNRTERKAVASPLAAPQPDNIMRPSQLNGNSFDLAGQNARMAAALAPGRVEPEQGAPQYTGPQVEYGTPGPGDFNKAAMDFAARAALSKGDLRGGQLLLAGSAQRSEQPRADALANSTIGLQGAQTFETTGQARNRAALTPAEINLRNSQATQNLAQAGESSARAALAPSEAALKNAQAGEATARGALAGATADRTKALTGGDISAQDTNAQLSILDLKSRQRVDALGTKIAASTDPKEIEKLGQQYLSLLGKDKPEEYSVHHAGGGTDKDGIKQPDTLVVFNKKTGKAEIISGGGTAAAAPPENHILALKQDPGRAKDFDAKYGAGAAAKYLKG